MQAMPNSKLTLVRAAQCCVLLRSCVESLICQVNACRQRIAAAVVSCRLSLGHWGVLQRALEPYTAQQPVCRAQRTDKAQAEWGRLILEQSTWTAHNRIETIATDRLSMRIPDAAEVQMVAP